VQGRVRRKRGEAEVDEVEVGIRAQSLDSLTVCRMGGHSLNLQRALLNLCEHSPAAAYFRR